MCWIGLPENKHIAQEDIKCKKVLLMDKLNRKFVSPYMLTPYELYEEYNHKFLPEELEPRPGDYMANNTKGKLIINFGIHCYDYDIQFVTPVIAGSKRMYAGLSIYEKRGAYSPAIVECTIPKGTLYYENVNKEIVTEKLIIDKILKVL
jgi:hypothetical protein